MPAKIATFSEKEGTSEKAHQSSWRAWILAARLRTLPLALPPIMVSSALAFQEKGSVSFFLAFFACCALLCIQMGTNLVNDALDFKKGADREGRIGPKRATQMGLLSYQQVLRGGLFAFVAAALFSLPLLISGGWLVGGVLLASLVCGYGYTGGPYPLSYLGISDFFILLFFGWVSVATLFYLQTGDASVASLIGGTQIGLLAIVPHAINNLRDRESDALAGKLTLAVRFGASFTKAEIGLCSYIPFLLGGYWLQKGELFAAVLPVIALPFIIYNVHQIVVSRAPTPIYNQFLARSALCQLLFGLLLALGLWIES